MVEFRNYMVKGHKFYKSDFNVEWIRKYLKELPKVILEFGSYDGGDGVFYKETFPSSEVFSIEACKERYDLIKPLESAFNIRAFNYAICEYDGFIDFYAVKDPNVMDCKEQFGSSGSINKRTDRYKKQFDHIKEQEPVSVPCIRLDSFCRNNNIKHIDFMHVDVEGAEHRVIEGLGDMRPSLIWMETHLGKDYYGEKAYVTSDLHNMMSNLSYKMVEKTSTDALYYFQ